MDESFRAMLHRSVPAEGGGVGAVGGGVGAVGGGGGVGVGARPGAVMHVRRRHATPSAGGGRLSPTMLLVMTFCFIGFATALYVFGFGKLYGSRTAAASS